MMYGTNNIPHARIVTPTLTYHKHAIRWDGVNAEIRRGADVKLRLTLTEEITVYPGTGAYRLVGEVDGQPQVWSVDNQGCGCGMAVKVTDTLTADVPV